jgi:hypothetical protein
MKSMNSNGIFCIEETIAAQNNKFDRINNNLNYVFLTCSAYVFEIKLSNCGSYACVFKFF